MRRTSSATAATAGVTRARLAVEENLGWLFREQSTEDYGIDAHAEVVADDDVSGRLLALQIKSGRSWFREPGPAGWWYRPGADHLQYWLSHSLPVAVVLYDPGTKRCHWQLVTPDTLVETSTGGLKLLVPEAQVLDAAARTPLRKAAEGDHYASPLHVAAADALLDADPLGPVEMFHDVDPAAAAVAAAHWLRAATDVTGRMIGSTPIQVVLEADNIVSIPVEPITFVLERLYEGRSPRSVVLDLIEHNSSGSSDDREYDRDLRPDARRPAHHLLEDLLDGIGGCRWLFGESDTGLDEGDLDGEALEDLYDDSFKMFVSTEAWTHRKRLL
jgi:hypothetical protein